MIQLVEFVSRYAIGVLLVIGSLAKWANFPQFVDTLKKYELAPSWAANSTAFMVALFELGVGAALFFKPTAPGATYGALCLFSIFTAAILINVFKGRFDMECGCGFWGKSRIGWHLVLRNLGLSGLAAISGGLDLGMASRLYPAAFLLSVALISVPLFPKLTCQH